GPPAPVARATAGPEAVGRPLALSFAAVPLPEPGAADRMSFQHALAAGSHAKVRYEVTVRQPREFALDAVVSFSPVADSAIVYRDGAEFTRYSWLDREGIPIPPARPGAEIRIVAWSSERGDSATMGVVAWAAERAASVSRGPGIEIFTPLDGAVLAVDRVYVGVKGEPNVPLVLYDGVKPIDTVRTRIDGVFDFIAVPLARGPHRLRVAMKNS